MKEKLEIDQVLHLFLDIYSQVTDYPVGIFYDESFTPLYSETAIEKFTPFCKYFQSLDSCKTFCENDHKRRWSEPHFVYNQLRNIPT